MNAARNLLDELAGIGATVRSAGEQLVLRAGPCSIPSALVRRVREAKGDLLAVLSGDGDDGDFCKRVVEWRNRHPAGSPPGRCAWCGNPESASAAVVPFGTEPGTHTWLHSECWPAWNLARDEEAALKLKVIDDAAPVSPHVDGPRD
jgi:hypothetical protein